MAKRKNPVEEIDETPVEVAEMIESTNTETAQPTYVEAAAESTEKLKSEPKEKAKKAPKQDVPDNVLAVLKTFSNYPELLVTPQGCVYTPGCKLAAAKAAILYKNPFYNT